MKSEAEIRNDERRKILAEIDRYMDEHKPNEVRSGLTIERGIRIARAIVAVRLVTRRALPK